MQSGTRPVVYLSPDDLTPITFNSQLTTPSLYLLLAAGPPIRTPYFNNNVIMSNRIFEGATGLPLPPKPSRPYHIRTVPASSRRQDYCHQSSTLLKLLAGMTPRAYNIPTDVLQQRLFILDVRFREASLIGIDIPTYASPAAIEAWKVTRLVVKVYYYQLAVMIKTRSRLGVPIAHIASLRESWSMLMEIWHCHIVYHQGFGWRQYPMRVDAQRTHSVDSRATLALPPICPARQTRDISRRILSPREIMFPEILVTNPVTRMMVHSEDGVLTGRAVAVDHRDDALVHFIIKLDHPIAPYVDHVLAPLSACEIIV